MTETTLLSSEKGKVGGTSGDSHEALSCGEVEIFLINCRNINILVDIRNQSTQDSEIRK